MLITSHEADDQNEMHTQTYTHKYAHIVRRSPVMHTYKHADHETTSLVGMKESHIIQIC